MTIYRLYVFLLDIAPPIWRRVELSSETSLAQLGVASENGKNRTLRPGERT